MAITDFLFPQGNFLNIRSNAPNQRSYNIGATEDLVRNLPGGFLKDLISPAAAATLSLPYDTIQGIGRAVDQSNIGTGPYRGIVDDTEIPRGPSLSDIGRAIDAENPLSSAIERTIGASGPLAERISNISNPFKMSQAAASEVDLSNRNINTTPYQDKIMGGVQGDPNPFGYQNQVNDFVIDNEDYQEIPGFNFKDAPTSLISRIQNPKFLNNPRNTIFDKAKSGIGKGFDLGKAAIGGIASLVSGVPGIGLLLNALGPMSPEDKAMRDFYGSQFGLTDTGQVASGIMKGYNPVSLFGSVGLNQAIDKRIARIQKTLKKKKSETLQNRLKELQALKAKESAASSAALEAQRRGRRPGTGGGGPPGTSGIKDTAASQGFSPGQAGAGSGGYSYDSGGREGFGYGLKDGGLAGLL